MTDKRIVSITDHLTEHQQKRIGKQTMTRDEVAELVTEIFGPLAALVREMALRQQKIEDHFGLAFVPGSSPAEAHFVRGERVAGAPRCARCGKALETDGERLTMLCSEYCGEVAEMATDGGDSEC